MYFSFLQTSSTTRRVCLWTVPRSVSTAFSLSVTTLPSVKLLFEPYSVPYYRQNPITYMPDSQLNYSYEEADEILLRDYPGKTAVFIKDFPYEIRTRYEIFLGERFKDFSHSFLIRDPQRAVLSCYRAEPRSFKDFNEQGTMGYTALYELYTLLKSKLNFDPVIIDADDLLAKPESMMKSYCERVGLPYKEGMTKWEPYSGLTQDFKDQYFFGYHWVNTALKSSGLQKPSTIPVIPEDVPQEVKKCIDDSFVPYNELYSLRMTL